MGSWPLLLSSRRFIIDESNGVSEPKSISAGNVDGPSREFGTLGVAGFDAEPEGGDELDDACCDPLSPRLLNEVVATFWKFWLSPAEGLGTENVKVDCFSIRFSS